jgi:hypothetical protein
MQMHGTVLVGLLNRQHEKMVIEQHPLPLIQQWL